MNDSRESAINAMRRAGLHRADFGASKPADVAPAPDNGASGYLPREQARAADVPEPDAWAWVDSLIKPIATYGALVLAAALALALILSPHFLNR